jgi:hypothetical protein
MTIIDDLKKRTEDGFKTLKETAQGIALNVEKETRIGRTKLDILKIQRRIQKVYGEVGEYVYGEYAMERPPTFESPFLRDRMFSIAAMKAEAREKEREIEDIRRAQPPDPDELPTGE